MTQLLHVLVGGRTVGAVDVDASHTLADVRRLIEEDELPVPQDFVLRFGGAPVSVRQETRRKALDCLPSIEVEAANGEPAEHGAQAEGGEPPPSRQTLTSTGSPDARRGTWSATPGSARSGRDSPGRSRREEPTKVRLKALDGPLRGSEFTFGRETVRIGRHTSNHLVVPEAGISRYHCEVGWEENLGFRVRDLGSTTGTFFYLKPHSAFPTFAGLMAKMGEVEFQVVGQSEEELFLQFSEGPMAGERVRVGTDGLTLGRRHTNGLVVTHDGTISAYHATLEHREGEFFLLDEGSSNGTCVRQSPERQESAWHTLLEGDLLGLGCTKLSVSFTYD